MIHFEKGDETVLEGLIVMDTGDYEDDAEVRLSRAENVYECVITVQAYYAKNKKWVVK